MGGTAGEAGGRVVEEIFTGGSARFGAACGDGYAHCAPDIRGSPPGTVSPWLYVVFLRDLRVDVWFRGESLVLLAGDSVLGRRLC